MIIRGINKEDAKAFLQFQRLLDQEAAFMLYEPNERATTVRQQKRMIADIIESETSAIYLAEETREIIGYVGIYGSHLKRIRHVGYVTIGIREAYCNKGLGRQLLKRAASFASAVQIKRLELTVVQENKRAVCLYKKCGYEEEGVRRNAVMIKGSWMDELYMAKFL